MINTPPVAPRPPRTPSAAGAASPAPADDALAAERQAFDISMEQQAELERERQALETLMLARLKDEDEIMKKFIDLI